MSYRVYQLSGSDADVGGPRSFICDLEADLPTSGLRPGDIAYTDEAGGKYWKATSVTAWAIRPYSESGGSDSPGDVKATAASSVPSGWLLCDGAAVSRTTYAALFSAIGTAYGAGDESTTFNLPNLKGRVPVGLDAAIPDFDARGKSGGAKTVTLGVGEIPSHTHVQNSHNHAQDPHNHTQDAHNHTQDAHNHTQDAHSHGQQIRNTGTAGTAGAQGANAANNATAGTTGSQTATNQPATATNQPATATNQPATATNQPATATNQNTGGGGAHENMPPYQILNWIIKT